MDENVKMPITRRGYVTLIIGVIVMISGFILMMGGASEDPQVFNEDIFDFRRLVAAPLVIILGIVIEIVGIMGGRSKENE